MSTLRLLYDLFRSSLGAGAGEATASELTQYEELLDIMGRNLDKMDAFVTDIVEAWRLYPGRHEVHPEPVSLNAVVEDIVAGLFPSAMQKDIVLDLVREPGLESILAESQRVGQVVSNLVGNAIKYTPREGSVTVYTRAAEGGAALEVTDTGPGIAREDRDKLFQRFARGRAKATGGEPSTGLGLYICRQIVEQYGGRIWFESEPGKGSSFFVFWPGAEGGKSKR